jgi:hypothetical protein
MRYLGDGSEVDTTSYERKKATIERLILLQWEKMVPFPASEARTKHAEAYQSVFRSRPDLFAPQSIPGKRNRQIAGCEKATGTPRSGGAQTAR